MRNSIGLKPGTIWKSDLGGRAPPQNVHLLLQNAYFTVQKAWRQSSGFWLVVNPVSRGIQATNQWTIHSPEEQGRVQPVCYGLLTERSVWPQRSATFCNRLLRLVGVSEMAPYQHGHVSKICNIKKDCAQYPPSVEWLSWKESNPHIYMHLINQTWIKTQHKQQVMTLSVVPVRATKRSAHLCFFWINRVATFHESWTRFQAHLNLFF